MGLSAGYLSGRGRTPIGSMIGASIGSRYGRGLSHVVLRRVFLIAGGLMGGRLLFFS